MKDVYWFGVFATWAVLSIAWLMVLGHCVYAYAGAYIQDEKVRGRPNKFVFKAYSHNGVDTFFLLIVELFLGFVGGLVWPAAWIVIFCISSLRGARAFVRFQKSYDSHKHDKETGVVV